MKASQNKRKMFPSFTMGTLSTFDKVLLVNIKIKKVLTIWIGKQVNYSIYQYSHPGEEFESIFESPVNSEYI